MPALFFFGLRALRMDPVRESDRAPRCDGSRRGAGDVGPIIGGTMTMRRSMNRRLFMGIDGRGQPEHAGDRGGAAEPAGSPEGPSCVASGNGLRAVEKAMELIKQGHDPLDAAIEGVAIVEADPQRPLGRATAGCPTRTASSSSTPPSCTGRPTAAARSPRSATSCTPRPSPGWS